MKTLARIERPPGVQIRRYTVLAALLWTLAMALSVAWGIVRERELTHTLAVMTASANFNKDVAIRTWAASHGGVYVPVTERTPRNPNLSHVPERDITTPSGRELTLMNPAYMIRQMMEEYYQLYGIRGRITSLKYLWEGNAPDEWERRGLEAFERGAKFVSEFTEMDGQPVLRYMEPLYTSEGCLKCHAAQGYRVGDIRGGIGLSVPMGPLYEIEARLTQAVLISHGAIWLIGLGAIALGFVKFSAGGRRTSEVEAALRQSRESLLRAQRIAHVGNWDWDIGSGALQWSDEIYRIFGAEPQSFAPTYEAFLGFVHHEDRGLVKGAVQEAIERRIPYDVEHRILLQNGTVRHMHEHGEVSYDDVGRAVFMTGTVQDVTGIRKAEREALLARDFYLGLLQKMPNPIWRMDTGGRYDYFNDAWLGFRGRSQEAEAGPWEAPGGWSSGIHPEDREAAGALMAHAVGAREPFECEFRLMHHSGEYHHVLDVGIPFYGLGGEFAGYIGSCYDIERHRRLEEEIRARLAEKDLMLQEIHHRVNNNMQIIMSLMRLQSGYLKAPEDALLLTECQGRIRTMASVHDLLYRSNDFSQVDLSSYVAKIAGSIFSAHPEAAARVRLSADVGKVRLGIDTAIPAGLIINELLSNALTHAFDGGRTGGVHVSLEDKGGGLFELGVEDDGRGLPEGFDPRGGGTFGMLLVDSLVDQLQGEIRAGSRPGGGARFVVTFREAVYRKRL